MKKSVELLNSEIDQSLFMLVEFDKTKIEAGNSYVHNYVLIGLNRKSQP